MDVPWKKQNGKVRMSNLEIWSAFGKFCVILI